MVTVLMEVCEETSIDICANGGVSARVVSFMCWSCDSIDFWAVANCDYRESNVAQSWMIDARSCWDSGLAKMETFSVRVLQIELVSMLCSVCWVEA